MKYHGRKERRKRMTGGIKIHLARGFLKKSFSKLFLKQEKSTLSQII
jgi:hypothetical protein